ncbi:MULTISPECIES: amino acid ABC transporter permease [Achromobacter]|uniref:Glutamate/aspartate import permease protein GltK n=1 Tax=Achromobacter aegrifaciens TaxID=1287736 RepID=A0AAD2J4N4_ACHAE|nr:MULTISPECIES: amino acid ABC transporter permease [Achromobacter]MBK1982678.1 amino acid ABC transporter permease [Achromobacter xylosoxidans]CUJ69495.1 Glutamate/aspartate transport system permease protein gltK [Achromobacter aegrifaciens]
MLNIDLSFFTWQYFSEYVLPGIYFSLALTVVAAIGGLFFGVVLALMRLSPSRLLAGIAGTYVDTMRSIPLVMVLLWFFLLVPPAAFDSLGSFASQHRSEGSAFITFIAFEAALYCEVIRAGILSVPAGQRQAGQALGMSYLRTMQAIVLPQALRRMYPVLLTQTIILFQDTSLVYAIGAYDMLKGFETAGSNLGRPVEAYIAAALMYFVICFSFSRLVQRRFSAAGAPAPVRSIFSPKPKSV